MFILEFLLIFVTNTVVTASFFCRQLTENYSNAGWSQRVKPSRLWNFSDFRQMHFVVIISFSSWFETSLLFSVACLPFFFDSCPCNTKHSVSSVAFCNIFVKPVSSTIGSYSACVLFAQNRFHQEAVIQTIRYTPISNYKVDCPVVVIACLKSRSTSVFVIAVALSCSPYDSSGWHFVQRLQVLDVHFFCLSHSLHYCAAIHVCTPKPFNCPGRAHPHKKQRQIDDLCSAGTISELLVPSLFRKEKFVTYSSVIGEEICSCSLFLKT